MINSSDAFADPLTAPLSPSADVRTVDLTCSPLARVVQRGAFILPGTVARIRVAT
jgi:hypothetical protein